VSFFLIRYSSGRLGDLPPEVAHEVDAVRWIPLADAPRVLSYKGEREMAERADAALAVRTNASSRDDVRFIMRRPP
jgi:hypothetical protein